MQHNPCCICGKETDPADQKDLCVQLRIEAYEYGSVILGHFDRLIYNGMTICTNCYYGKDTRYVPNK